MDKMKTRLIDLLRFAFIMGIITSANALIGLIFFNLKDSVNPYFLFFFISFAELVIPVSYVLIKRYEEKEVF